MIAAAVSTALLGVVSADHRPIADLGSPGSSNGPSRGGSFFNPRSNTEPPSTPPKKNSHTGPLLSVGGISPLTPLSPHPLDSGPTTPPPAEQGDSGMSFPINGIDLAGPLMQAGSPLDQLTDSTHPSYHAARCPAHEFWERGGCFSIEEFGQRTLRFTLIPGKNLELLQNSCRGMKLWNEGHATNTAILTYRPKPSDDSARDKLLNRVRAAAGCVPGRCKNIMEAGGLKGLDPAYGSCEEYPPATSMEGGDTRPLHLRSIACVPSRQNSHQGGVMAALGRWRRNSHDHYKFVLSINCDVVAQQGGGIYQPESLPHLLPPEPVHHLISREEYSPLRDSISFEHVDWTSFDAYFD